MAFTYTTTLNFSNLYHKKRIAKIALLDKPNLLLYPGPTKNRIKDNFMVAQNIFRNFFKICNIF